ncbi:hypothetical protein B9J87_09160 [Vibrio sp. V19_P1S1T109]|uniref:hypothetical protein n=1 Tax=Vibrio sp. V19_P1S1T109 TaxID=1938672 RepID=UPI000B8E53DC|nr:hypothetical protein [Vibrio sp. V19_P1S1T109]OXX72188.1 hypothetical protein B9J87_09160 [Vibrio sp. V19_P1S1T109]
MSIKKSIAFLLLTFGVSFNASAEYKVNFSHGGLGVGMVFSDFQAMDSFYIGKCVYYAGKYINLNRKSNEGNLSRSYSGETGGYNCSYGDGGYYQITVRFEVVTPPPPPVCTPPEELSPVTNECYLPEFCDRQSTWDEIAQGEASCAEQKGIFTYSCSDFFQSLDMRCDEPNVCAMGMPNWPDCMPDPSTPIDPSDPFRPIPGGDAPSTGGERPTVPDVTPPTGETSDPALLSAVQNMNADLNKSVTTLNNNNVDSFAALNKQLTDLNSKNSGIGQSIVDQMNNDIKIADNNKKLIQQQNKVISDSGVYVGKAISGQTNSLTEAIGTQTTDIVGAIEALGEKIPTPCDPNADPFRCQGENGLSESYIDAAYTQMIAAADTELSAANSALVNYARVASIEPMTDETQVYIDMAVGDLLGVLPSSSDCVDFPMVTSMGTFTLGCEFSTRLKSIISFLIYVFTLWTLIDILLNGVTPVSGTTPYMSRR